MVDFVSAAFWASRALGGPGRLARRLGVEPDLLYRWIAGQDLPAKEAQGDLQKRITLAMIGSPALPPASRRHGDS